MATFGISLSGAKSCILQPPSGKNPGALYLVLDQETWKLELSDQIITPHRTALPVQSASSNSDKSLSVSSVNFEFVTELLRSAIDSNSFTLTNNPASVKIKYTINGVACEGDLSGFAMCHPVEIIKCMAKELNRMYGKVSDIQELATSRGIELSVETTKNEVALVEKIQQAELRRKNLSTINPNLRAKKVTKGFGSK